MPSVLDTIASIDFGRLTERLDSARSAVNVQGDFSNLDPAALLGELGALARVTDFPRNPEDIVRSIRDGFTELGQLFQLPHIQTSVEMSAQIEALLAVIQRIVEDLSGDLDGLVDGLLEDAGSLTDVLAEMVDRVMSTIPSQIPDFARGPIQALQTLSRQKPSSSLELANAVSLIVAGVDLEGLNGPALKLNAFLEEIRAAGGGFAQVEFHWGAITNQVRAAIELLRQPGVDEGAVFSGLDQIRGALDLMFSNVLPGAMAGLTADLGRLNPAALHAELNEAMTALLGRFPQVPFDLEEMVMEGLGETLAIIENTSAEDLEARIAALETHAQEAFRASNLGGIPERIDSLFDLLIDRIREVPVRRLRHQLVDAIAGIEARIRDFEGFSLPNQLMEHLAKIESAIDDLDVSAIQSNVQSVTEAINNLAEKFPIQEIKEEIEGLVASVTDAVDQFAPVLDQISSQMDQLAGQIGNIDLSAAGDASIELMGGIRENIQSAVDSADLPEPAKIAIATAASALKEINISVELRQPFTASLDQIDLTGLLDPLEPLTGRVREALEKVAPRSLIEQLDDPFRQLTQKLENLKPSALLAHVSVEFERLLDRLSAADPRVLIGPVESEFQQLLSRLREMIDPTILFAPLRAIYARLQELLDRIDFTKLFSALSRKLVTLPGTVRDSLETAVNNRGGTAVNAVPGVNLGSIKVGDFLRPLALLVAQLRKVVADLGRDLIMGAVSLLQSPLRAVRDMANPALGILGAVAREVDQRAALLNPFAASGPVAELRLAIEQLESAAASASLSSSGRTQIGPVLVSIRLETRAPQLAGTRAGLEAQLGRLSSTLPPPDLSSAVRKLGSIVENLFPDGTDGADLAANATAFINQLFDSFDPAPIADRLDDMGARALAKLESLANDILQAIARLVTSGFKLIDSFTPAGVLQRINTNFDRVKNEFAVLDPAPIEAEVRKLVEAVLDGLNHYSPANLAGLLGGSFDSVRQKLDALNPATLLGDLSAVESAIDAFGQLRPSIVLGPLLESTAGIEAALDQILSFDPGQAVVRAVANLRAQLGDIIDGIEAEFRALIDFLEQLAGDSNASITASASIG